MTIILAGGSGLLGRALATRLGRDGHRVLTLTRRPRPGVENEIAWQPDGTAGSWAAHLDGADAVVNLAGEGIADKRFTTARKHALRTSRVLPTRSLVQAIGACQTPPKVFISSSAIGYYGAHGDEPVTEQTPPGTDFLARLCAEWEQEAVAADGPRTRVVMLRTGIVLNPHGGALVPLLLPFKLGLGARLGSGRQFMPWIHVQDWIELVVWLIGTDEARGAFNLTAPVPVTNREFTRTLGRVLGRPAVFWAPGFALKVALGEFAEFLLTGQRVLPARAEQLGFRFRFEQLGPALKDLLG